MFTREDYMSGKVTHEDYYSQFVTEQTKLLVLTAFSLEELRAGGDHFNGLPLRRWDILSSAFEYSSLRSQLKAAGDVYSLGTGVCVLKQAAREILAAAQ